MTNDATPKQDNGSLTFEQVAAKMVACVEQLIVLDAIDKVVEAGQRGEDYHLFMETLIKVARNLGGRGTYDQQQ